MVAGPMAPALYRVRSRTEETDDTVTLTLVPDGERVDTPAPGQFNMLWAFGVGEAPISLAGLDGSHLVHTIRRVGAVTRALCDTEPGDVVGVRGPFGVGWNLERAVGRDVLVVAGGLGVAPIRPVVEAILDHRDRYRQVAVLIGARTPDDLLYPSDLQRWHDCADLQLAVTVDAAPTTWKGNVGLVTQLLAAADVDPSRTVAVVCGPEIMMRFVARGVIDHGGSPSETFVSMERNMHCAIGHCGHCQLGPAFICKDGPVLDWTTIEPLLAVSDR